jgi:enamine deaminase RidA (YjgF/YER057c/UK114 family)
MRNSRQQLPLDACAATAGATCRSPPPHHTHTPFAHFAAGFEADIFLSAHPLGVHATAPVSTATVLGAALLVSGTTGITSLVKGHVNDAVE